MHGALGPGASTRAADRPWVLEAGLTAPAILGGIAGTLRLFDPAAAREALAAFPAAGSVSVLGAAHLTLAALVAASIAVPAAVQWYRLASPAAAALLAPVHAVGAACAAALGFVLGPAAALPALLLPGGVGAPLDVAHMATRLAAFARGTTPDDPAET